MNIQAIEKIPVRISRLMLMSGALFVCNTLVVSRVCAQSPVAITDTSTPVALSTNNTNSSSTYVLNSDASVSILQNTGFASGGCGPITNLSGGHLASAAVSFDSTTNRLYAVMEEDSSTGAGLGAWVTFVTISGGTCTNGPTGQISTTTFGNIELGVDPGEDNVYVVQATEGVSRDALFILNPADFSDYVLTANPTLPLVNPPQVFLDYSASYGPIVVDPNTHRVYINDFGTLEDSPAPGLVLTPGFFVYDPTHTTTVTDNIQHVYGYVNSGEPPVQLSAQTLLVNAGAPGDLILVNQNTSLASGQGATFQTAPFTILHTSASGFSFFSNTESGPSGSVYISPGTSGMTVIGPSSNATLLYYSATGSADIDSANGTIYRFAYNANGTTAYNITLVQDSGALIAYDISTMQDKLLADDLPMANIYPSPAMAAWNQLTYNSESNNVMVTVADAMGVSNPLSCAGPSIQQVLGGGSTLANLLPPATNFTSGYDYAIATSYPNTNLYYVAPLTTCANTDLTLSPTLLPSGVAGQAYGPVQFSVTSGAQGMVTYGSPNAPSGLGVSSSGSLSGTPTQVGTFEVTVNATDSNGDTGSETLPLTINCQTITVGPSPLPGATLGVPYNITFTQSGGIGNVTYQAFGPFPPGISPTANGLGLSGIPTSTGSFPIGIQATDSNGCMSQNLIQTLTVSSPRFSMAFGLGYGPSACAGSGPGFPLGVVPTVTVNGVSYFQVNVNLYNNGNVPASANLTSALLGGFQTVNTSDPPVSGLPIIFNNPGTLLVPGGCVGLSFYYPTTDYTSVSIPLAGYTEANIPQVLKLQGTFAASTTGIPSYSGSWSLTDREVLLNSNICCTSGVITGVGGTAVNGNVGGTQ